MISCYCDGSSASSGGKPGGWAFVLVLQNRPLVTDAGGDLTTSNNAMELTAAIRGLQCAQRLARPEPLELVSDSQYALGMASGDFSPSKNLELVAELRSLVLALRPRLRWVRGHNGDRWNEVVDRLAKHAKVQIRGGA